MLAPLERRHTVATHSYNRWLIPPAALAVHLCIGQQYVNCRQRYQHNSTIAKAAW